MSNDTISKGKVIILSAPSGGGKSSIAGKLLKDDQNLALSVSATTRKPRPGEIDGVDYFFLTIDEFNEILANDLFLEHAKVYGNYYGTPKKFVEEQLLKGRDVLFDVDSQGAYQIMNKIKHGVISFFILPPSLEELKKRLSSRKQDSKEIIEDRLREAEIVMEEAVNYDYRIINDNFDEACEKIENIIKQHRKLNK